MSSAGQNDEKLAFISHYLYTSLKIKEEQWTRFYESEIGRNILRELIESQSPLVLFFTLSANGNLSASKDFSAKGRTKICFFINTLRGSVEENSSSPADILCGDLQPNILRGISSFLQRVIQFHKCDL